MLPAIDLDNQSCRQTGKIHDVWAEWVLTAKSRAGDALSPQITSVRSVRMRRMLSLVGTFSSEGEL
jgi:hypothetical protein